MRKKKEVLRDLNQALEQMRGISGDPAKVEECQEATDRVRSLSEELNTITVAEEAERAAARAQSEAEEVRDISKRFSFAKFIREAGEGGNLTGVEAEVAQMGEREAKSNGIEQRGFVIPASVLNNRAFAGQSAGVDADGGYTIESEMRYQEELRKRLVLSQLGAVYMGGLSGNIDLIQGSAVTAGWLDENEEGSDSKKTFTKKSVGPMRCFVNVPISKLLTIQSSIDVERVITNDILGAHTELVEDAALNGTGTKQPLGLLNTSGIASVALGENGGTPTFKTVVDLETEIALKNADISNMAYLTNPKVRGLLKTTLKSSNVPGYIWSEGNEMNGYRALATNFLPSDLVKGTAKNCSPIIFGDWSNLWIMGWGGLDLIVDPYSLKKMGAYEVTLNAYHNIFVKRTEGFAICKDVLTA